MTNSRPRCSRTFSSVFYTLTTMVFVSHVHQSLIRQHCVYSAIQAELLIEDIKGIVAGYKLHDYMSCMMEALLVLPDSS